jgi:MFS transporter, SP family, general alpha glucoside:H+ symporter
MSEKIMDETDIKSVGSQTAERDESALQAIRAQPKVFAWCVYVIFVTFLNSFDYNAAGSVISIPEFRKDFGYLYEGEWTLQAAWQSAFSGGALAT